MSERAPVAIHDDGTRREMRPFDWRERPDDWGDDLAELDRLDRASERADSPQNHMHEGHAG